MYFFTAKYIFFYSKNVLKIVKETKSDKERIENENRERNLVDLIPAHNLTLPDFKASESERWCLFEVNVGRKFCSKILK